MKDGEIKNKLSPAQVSVMRHKVTEPPYFGKYWDHFAAGVYRCAACDTSLFSSADKFDSKTGWPTFKRPINERDVQFKNETGPDDKVEIRCKKCKSHLGYVISAENPYYRINSVCLDFRPETPAAPAIATDAKNEKAPAPPEKPARPEFPLPPPAIALIEDEPARGWHIASLAAGTAAGIVIGASGVFWYIDRYAAQLPPNATSTAPVATTTEPVSDSENEPVIAEEPEPTPEPSPATLQSQNEPENTPDGATSTQ
jgi:peptide-methionine (R)-S-oxide reductase